jgi:hypothetical protein
MAFNGKVESDFLKLVNYPNSDKSKIINYAATDFESLRDSLIEYIKTVYPLDYQNFSESDLGVMLIELVAYMGAVMSMKADMLANENYLATAKNRNNVKKLLELVGIRMKGPISAAADASLTLDNGASQFTELTIPISNRVIGITSPEDGGILNYTLYKVENGQLSDPRADGALVLNVSESDSTTSTVWSNLALLEGALVTETGTVTSKATQKSISLNSSPIIEKSVTVFITSNDNTVTGAWVQVDSLFSASGAAQKYFEVVYTDDFGATVLFGDGVNGKVLPTNASYSITYRVGGGTRGNIASEAINAKIIDTNSQIGTLQNISLATGGRDAESVEHAKKYAPLYFKLQDRLVTAEDYSTFANAFCGSVGATGKARAVVRNAYSSANVIDIYLLQIASNLQLQQATIEFKKQLLDAIEPKKMLTDEIVIVDGVIRTVDLVITARIDKYNLPREEEIKARIRDGILDYFSVENFDFGKPLIVSDIARAVFSLPEIRYATVDNLDADISIDFNEIVQLNNFTINIIGV